MSWLAIGGGIGLISAGSRSATGQNIIGLLIVGAIFSAPFYFLGQRYFKTIYPVTISILIILAVSASVILISVLLVDRSAAASLGSFGGSCAVIAAATFALATMFYIGADDKMLVDRTSEVMPVYDRPITTLARHTGFTNAAQIYRCSDRTTDRCAGGDMFILDDGAIRSLKFWFGRVGGLALLGVIIGWTASKIGVARTAARSTGDG